MQRDVGQLSCLPIEIEDGTCKYYYIYEFMSGGSVRTYTRNYKDFITAMGDLGGVREVVYSLVFYLYVLYNNRERKRAMVASIYKLKP